MFGPGQFQSLYKHVTIPAAHALHFAGEATSVHHAWVEGALSSAFRSVAEIVSFIPVNASLVDLTLFQVAYRRSPRIIRQTPPRLANSRRVQRACSQKSDHHWREMAQTSVGAPVSPPRRDGAGNSTNRTGFLASL